MARRDENGCQITRRDTIGISEKSECLMILDNELFMKAAQHGRYKKFKEFITEVYKKRIDILLQLWLTLAERHLDQRGVDWKQAEKICFNEWSNPDDEELGIQIVKVSA